MLATYWLLLQLGTDPASLCSSSLFFFFFLVELVFFFFGSFFSLQIPLFKIWNYQISFWSLFFVFFHFFFIFSRSDHNFIPVYWPKFIRKAETKRNHPKLSPYFFPIERFLMLKKTAKLRSSLFFRSNRMVRSRFQNHDEKWSIKSQTFRLLVII